MSNERNNRISENQHDKDDDDITDNGNHDNWKYSAAELLFSHFLSVFFLIISSLPFLSFLCSPSLKVMSRDISACLSGVKGVSA